MAIGRAKAGEVIEAGDTALVPLARSLRLALPFGLGGFVWNRPLGVVVRDASGGRFVRVPDRTRQIQWLLLASGLAAGLLLRWASSSRLGGDR